MPTSLQLRSKIDDKDPVVYLLPKNAKWKLSGFNPKEAEYLERRISQDEKLIVINRFDTIHIVQVQEDGKKENYKRLESYRLAGARIAGLINSQKFKSVQIVDTKNSADDLLALAEGIQLGNYQFLKYKHDQKKEEYSLKNIFLTGSSVKKDQLEKLSALTEAVYLARTLVNEPVSYLTAPQFSEEIKAMGKMAGFKVEVFNKAKIESLKMGGLLSVNRGSITPPTFNIMEWKPKGAVNKKPLVLVGKGVVYDTGGLSLKPTPNSMDTMKCDMAGGAAVVAAIYAVAKLKLPYYVVGLIPATDNRPGEEAYTPGDVVEMSNGKTVEVLNTDAEGRMILGDALTYAKKYDPWLVLDFATLTGAAAAAIGPYGIVCMGTADENIKNNLKASGLNTYERLVEFPFWDEYKKLINSDLADMKNIGGPIAGAITAGKFLEHYIDYPWMHFDIAGPAFISGTDGYRIKGGTGIGVRLLFDFIQQQIKGNGK